MGALNQILASEKGLIGLLLIICATILAAMNKLSFAQWSDYTTYIFGIYVAGKTVQAVGSSIAARPAAPIAPVAQPPATPPAP